MSVAISIRDTSIAFCRIVDLASAFVFIIAWFGFRVHLSNSIALNLLGRLRDGMTAHEMEREYDIPKRIEARVHALRESGYLAHAADHGTQMHARTRLVLLLLRITRGERTTPR